MFATVEEAVREIKAGRMVVVVDDEDRENEGDLTIAAEFCTPEAVNFMAKFGRGLICLTLTEERADYLRLGPMTSENTSRFGTAFTESIEAREGVTTGISAADRARTIAVAIDPSSTAADLARPGHVFPLRARKGGVLVRAGQTEASVDLARMAGLVTAGVICEIMNDDGTMARLPDLVAFAQRHNLKLGTIADLIAYRRRTEKLVKRVEEGYTPSKVGEPWLMIVYKSLIDNVEHIAMVKGDVTTPEPVLVRMHAVDTLMDVLAGEQISSLQAARNHIRSVGRGVIVLIREASPTAASDRIRALISGTKGPAALRDYGIGAQILSDLGVKDMILLSNHKRTIVGLEGYGLNVVEQRDIGAAEGDGA